MTEEDYAIWERWRKESRKKNDVIREASTKKELKEKRAKHSAEITTLLIYNPIICYPLNLYTYWKYASESLALLSLINVLLASSPLIILFLKRRKGNFETGI